MKTKKILSLLLSLCMVVSLFTVALPTFAEEETSNTVEIGTLQQLLDFAAAVNAGNDYAGKTVVITADIDLSSVTNWTPIGHYDATKKASVYLKANIEGKVVDGETTRAAVISGLTITDRDDYGSAFIGYFGGASAKNITIKGAKVSSTKEYAAAFIAYASVQSATFENITVVDCEVNALHSSAALIGATAGGNNYFYNCTVDNCKVHTTGGYGYAGAFIGIQGKYAEFGNANDQTKGNTVKNCTITTDQGYVGTIGYSKATTLVYNMTVENNTFSATKSYVSALMGSNQWTLRAFDSIFKNNTIKGTSNVGLTLGASYYDWKFENETARCAFIGNNIIGTSNTGVVYGTNACASGTSGNTYKIYSCYAEGNKIGTTADTLADNNTLVGTESTATVLTMSGNTYAGNDTTWYNAESTEFTIDTAEKWGGFAQLVNAGNTFEGKTVTVTADLDLGAYSAYCFAKNLVPSVGTYVTATKTYYRFMGTLKGDVGEEHNAPVISNYWQVSTDYCAGLLGDVKNATLSNLTVDKATIHSKFGYSAIFCGEQDGASTFEKITITNSAIYANTNILGGVLGQSGGLNLTMTDCAVSNTLISGYSNVGAIAAHLGAGSKTDASTNTITNCSATKCTLTTTLGNAGAIIGRIYGQLSANIVRNCTATGCKVTTTTSNAGGIIGVTDWAGSQSIRLMGCLTDGCTITTGTTGAGGLIGYQCNACFYGEVVTTEEGKTINMDAVNEVKGSTITATTGYAGGGTGSSNNLTVYLFGLNIHDNTISAGTSSCVGGFDGYSKANLVDEVGDAAYNGFATKGDYTNVIIKDNTIIGGSYVGAFLGSHAQSNTDATKSTQRIEITKAVVTGNTLIVPETCTTAGLFIGYRAISTQTTKVLDCDFSGNKVIGLSTLNLVGTMKSTENFETTGTKTENTTSKTLTVSRVLFPENATIKATAVSYDETDKLVLRAKGSTTNIAEFTLTSTVSGAEQTFAPETLAAGNYEVALLDSANNVILSKDVTVATLSLSVEKTMVTEGDPITVTVMDPTYLDCETNYVALVRDGDTTPLYTAVINKDNNNVAFDLSKATKNTEKTADELKLNKGNYKIVYVPAGKTIADATKTIDLTIQSADGMPLWYDATAEEIVITKAEDLVELAQYVNGGVFTFEGKTLVIGADIDLTGVNFTGIGTYEHPFMGNLKGSVGTEGKAAVITGMTINAASNAHGFFGYFAGATISNIEFKNASITGDKYLGVVVGVQTKDTTYTNVTVTGGTITADSYAAGIVASVYTGSATFTKCSVDGFTATGSQMVAGMVAYAAKPVTVTECKVANIDVKATTAEAALYGYASGVIGYSCADIVVTGTTVTDSKIEAVLNYAAGIIGCTYGKTYPTVTIEGCTIAGCTIKAGSSFAGGLGGDFYSTKTTISGNTVCASSKNKTTIEGGLYIGGLYGSHEWATGAVVNVTGNTVDGVSLTGYSATSCVGGLVGAQSNATTYGTEDGSAVTNTVKNCTIKGKDAVGGIMGTTNNLTTFIYQVVVENNTIEGENYVAGANAYGCNNQIYTAGLIIRNNTIKGNDYVAGAMGCLAGACLNGKQPTANQSLKTTDITIENNKFEVPADIANFGLVVGYVRYSSYATELIGKAYTGNTKNGDALTVENATIVGVAEGENVSIDFYGKSTEEETTASEEDKQKKLEEYEKLKKEQEEAESRQKAEEESKKAAEEESKKAAEEESKKAAETTEAEGTTEGSGTASSGCFGEVKGSVFALLGMLALAVVILGKKKKTK